MMPELRVVRLAIQEILLVSNPIDMYLGLLQSVHTI